MNVRELKAQMIRQGKTIDQLCASCGISKTSWFRKTTGVSEFTQGEISVIRRELDLDPDQTMLIFFDSKVS